MKLPFQRSHPYDVGVLLVHGIGQQRRGETLVEAGGALYEVMGGVLAGLGGARGPVELRPGPAQVEADPARPEDPPWAEWTLGNLRGRRVAGSPEEASDESRLLLAEAWWAGSFPEPRHSEVFEWVVRILPLVVVSHFDRRTRRTWFEFRNRDARSSRLISGSRLVLEVIRLVAGMILAPPLLVAILGLSVLGFLPVPLVDSAARLMQQVLAAVIGDSYVLLSKPLARGAILETVRRNVRWLASRCERIVLVAHSQGGAIAHEVARTDPLLECSVLFTYGSGLQKLAMIQRLKAEVSAVDLWLAVMGSLVATGSVVMAALGVGPVGWGWSTVMALAGVAMSAVMVRRFNRAAGIHYQAKRQWHSDERLFKAEFQLPNSRIRWVDVYASDDPVPNGPLLDEYWPRSSEYGAHPCWNLGSPLLDHTAYWQNRDDFVARVARILLGEADVALEAMEPGFRSREDVVVQRRRWRVGWRRRAPLAALAGTLGLAFQVRDPVPTWMVGSLRWLESMTLKIPLVGSWLVGGGGAGRPPTLDTPLGVLLGVGCLGLVLFGLQGLWEAWNRTEMGQAAGRRAFSFWAWGHLAYVAAVAAGFAVGVGAFFGWVFGVFVLALFGLRFAWVALVQWLPVAGAGWRDAVLATTASGDAADVEAAWRRRGMARRAARGAGDPRALYEAGLKGVASMDPGQRAEGERQLLEAARLGYGIAAWRLGMFREEERTPPDLTGAREAYELGKAHGDALATCRLARLLETRLKDVDGAIREYRYAAYQLREPIAAHSLGLLLWRGKPVRRAAAMRAFRQGVALRDALSCQWLAELLVEVSKARYRRGGRRSAEGLLRLAEPLFRKAVDLGAESAVSEWAALHEATDPERAVEILERGVRLRSGEACLRLGRLQWRRGLKGSARRFLERAVEVTRRAWPAPPGQGLRVQPVFREAARELGVFLAGEGERLAAMRTLEMALGAGPGDGDGGAAVPLAGLLEGEVPPVPERIEAVLRRGHELGSIAAGLALGRRLAGTYATRVEGRRVLCRAVSRARRSYAPELGEALFVLGAALEEGLGSRDRQGSRVCWFQAMQRGHAPAAARLVQSLVDNPDRGLAVSVAGHFGYEFGRRWPLETGLRLARLLLLDGEMEAGRELLRALRASEGAGRAPGFLVAVGEAMEQAGDLEGASWAFRRAALLDSVEGAAGLQRIETRRGNPYAIETAARLAAMLGAGGTVTATAAATG